jgi:hypothetical protein
MPEELNLVLKNPEAEEMSCTASWQLPPGWQIEPAQTAIRVPSSGQRAVKFSLHISDQRLLSGKLPKVVLQFPQSDGTLLPLYMPLPISDVPQVCGKISQPLKIDGNLSDWGNTPGLLFRKMHGSKDLIPDDFCPATRLLLDDKWLYISAEIWDDDIQVDGDEVTYDIGDIHLDLKPDVSKIRLSYGDSTDLASDYSAAIKIRPGGLIYELAIPITHLAKALPQPGSKLSATINVYDKDGSIPRQWLWESWDIKFE